ncbi:MAG TPA: hypothetical protein PLK99_01565, partial [Burkholderiales bacterium]|nr:hypothetical protein [Burkholderiales bacterium]
TRMIEIDAEMEKLKQKSEPISSETEVRNYLAIIGGVRKKGLLLTEEQKANFQKLGNRIAPALKALSAINAEIQALQQEKDDLVDEGMNIEKMEQEASSGISCNIENISKDTLVTRRKIEAAQLFDLHPKELRVKLREAGIPENRLPMKAGCPGNTISPPSFHRSSRGRDGAQKG